MMKSADPMVVGGVLGVPPTPPTNLGPWISPRHFPFSVPIGIKMHRMSHPLFSASFLALLLSAPAAAQGTQIGFIEDYALATDRNAALDQLIPGTEEYYYYHCLQRQHEGRYEDVEELMATWLRRHSRGAWMREIENRQAMLTFPSDPDRSLNLVRERISLRFDHQRQVAGESPNLPTQLDPAVLSWESLRDRALSRHPHRVDGFRSASYDRLMSMDLSSRQNGDLLSKLLRPDAPNLVQRIVADLKGKRSEGWGSHKIHSLLTLSQLDSVAEQFAQVRNDTGFISEYLERLAPSSDTNLTREPAAELAYLERLQAFSGRLSPAQNSLKVHVLYHRLQFDLKVGAPNKARFMAYLQLPRNRGPVNRDFVKGMPGGHAVADVQAEFSTKYASARSDEGLIRDYLEHQFQTEDSYEPYLEWLDKDWVERVFAETKIMAGVGDMERWYSLLDSPSRYEALRDRVEIKFPVTQRTNFDADEGVRIDVDLKNVETLLIKVFEINALNYYLQEKREVDASIPLDGLIANEEAMHTYEVNALRRVRRTFEFPELSRPGVFVVEFIGNGISSRAVLRKGRLQYTERIGAAGHVFHVLDERGRPVDDASIRLSGRIYRSDETGGIPIPFSTAPGQRKFILEGAGRTTMERFQHQEEGYSLEAGIHIDREMLLEGHTAKILVRPVLRVNGYQASLKLLESPHLVLVSTNLHGTQSTQIVRNLELAGDAEYVHEINVPPGLVRLDVELRGKVELLSTGADVNLNGGSKNFMINGIQATAQVASPMLGLTPQGFVIDLLGRNGEPIADRALSVRMSHSLVTDDIDAQLKTDAHGRAHLGPLPDVTHLKAMNLGQETGRWDLDLRRRDYPSRVHGLAGSTLWIPLEDDLDKLTRSVASLFELRSGEFTTDHFSNLTLNGAYLGVSRLPAGTYQLFLKAANRTIDIEITDGRVVGGWGVGRNRMLELQPTAGMHLQAMGLRGDALEVRVANATDNTRVHVTVDRYMPTFDAWSSLGVGSDPTPIMAEVVNAYSSYRAGREIGDEYRYILDRRLTNKYPGNMLSRPGLLLNPWATESTNAVFGIGGGAAGKFGSRSGGGPSALAAPAVGPPVGYSIDAGSFASLDYLPDTAVVLTNLRPGKDGIVRIPRSELGGGHVVTAVVIDGAYTVTRTSTLTESPYQMRDRRLADGLDPDTHLSQQRSIDFVAAGSTVTIEDVGFSTAETYDDLSSVYRLYQSLSGNEYLTDFEPLLRWNELDVDARVELYDALASHELHVFLFQKDRAFFDGIVAPYLANKGHKTFLDYWLLEADLAEYLDPWKFEQLNLVERILLTRRMQGRGEDGARHIRELWEMIPPDLEERERWFNMAMANDSMDTKEGLAGRLRGKHSELQDDRMEGGSWRRPASSGAFAVSPVLTGSDRFFLGATHDEEEAAPELEEAIHDADLSAQRGLAQMEDLGRRQRANHMWRDADPTKAYAEHNYYQRSVQATTPDMIRANGFWTELASAPTNQPFRSSSFVECAGSFAEMLLALSFLDLPFEAAEHEIEFDGARMTMKTAGPMILLREDLQAAQTAEGEAPLLISQNFYRHDDRYLFVDNQRRDKFVTREFLRGIAYGCEVVLTNPTSTPRELEVLMQIPEGAIALEKGSVTIGRTIYLDAYEAQSHEFAFYFPKAGNFTHYPAHVARAGNVVGHADSVRLNVVDELSVVDMTSWEYISQLGSNDDVLAHLDAANLQRLDLTKIAWRLRDRTFFNQVIGRLRTRHRYDGVLWSYGVHHRDLVTTREYLSHASHFLNQCGLVLDSPLVTIDPVERKNYQHIDFDPLINARAHPFGDRREIFNHDLAYQYLGLLSVLSYRPVLTDADWLDVTYYLMLQDRVTEALQAFARVDASKLSTGIQYDAMRAYLAFYSDDPWQARDIALKYVDHPVARWRNQFNEILAQLDEIGGGGIAIVDSENLNQNQTSSAAAEPTLDLDVEAGQVSFDYQNLDGCEVRYYEMDIEFLFSTSPFVQQGSNAFAYIRPNLTQYIPLDANQSNHSLVIPTQFASSNLMVEVRGAGVTRRQAHYANELNVQAVESFGQLKVSHATTQAALAKVYVKVFAKLSNGTTRFHKDGYTDHRGRFDYVSLSATDAETVERFSVLILSESDGAVIRELAPPQK
jgi:hypothetical protein